MPAAQRRAPVSTTPPERFGPPEAEIGKIQQVPPHPTIPYTLGATTRQLNRRLTIGVATWVVVVLVVFSGYLF